MDFVKHHDIMQQDAGDYDDDDDDDYDNYDDNFVSDCPEGCRCSKNVLQCSDQGKHCIIQLYYGLEFRSGIAGIAYNITHSSRFHTYNAGNSHKHLFN